MSESKKMSLMNKELYKNKILDNENVIFEYVKILHEYLSHITKNININSMVHNNFIINRGYDLLKNIFLTLILYTKNLELSCFHLRKSYLYYTEFIGQIAEDSNSYLQLNSKDACLFVYKKTIYNIKVERIKDIRISIIKILNEINKIKIENIEKIEIFLNFFIFSKFSIDKKISIFHLFLKKINKEKIDKKKIISLSLYYEKYSDISPLKFINKIFK